MCQKKLRSSQHSLTYRVLRVTNGHWSDTFPSNQPCGTELVIYTNTGSNPLNAPQCHRVTYQISPLLFFTVCWASKLHRRNRDYQNNKGGVGFITLFPWICYKIWIPVRLVLTIKICFREANSTKLRCKWGSKHFVRQSLTFVHLWLHYKYMHFQLIRPDILLFKSLRSLRYLEKGMNYFYSARMH